MRRVLLPVVLVSLAAAPVGSASAVASGGQAETAAQRVVVAPAKGQVVRANTARVRVRAPRGTALRARLNGAAVGRDFARARRGVRTLRASISHGLRRGRNVLRVRVVRPGRATRRTVVRFRVQRPRELVGAGRDRTIVLGGRWRLGGRVLKGVAPWRARPRAGVS